MNCVRKVPSPQSIQTVTSPTHGKYLLLIRTTTVQSQTVLSINRAEFSSCSIHLVSRSYFSSNIFLYSSWLDQSSAAWLFSGLSLFGSVTNQQETSPDALSYTTDITLEIHVYDHNQNYREIWALFGCKMC